jgi:hypothetical protein
LQVKFFTVKFLTGIFLTSLGFLAFILLFTSNIREILQRRRDHNALKFYNALEATLPNLPESNIMVINLERGTFLPKPFQISLSRGVHLRTFIKLSFGETLNFSALEVYHPEGSKLYRYVKFNDRTLSQVIETQFFKYH